MFRCRIKLNNRVANSKHNTFIKTTQHWDLSLSSVFRAWNVGGKNMAREKNRKRESVDNNGPGTITYCQVVLVTMEMFLCPHTLNIPIEDSVVTHASFKSKCKKTNPGAARSHHACLLSCVGWCPTSVKQKFFICSSLSSWAGTVCGSHHR